MSQWEDLMRDYRRDTPLVPLLLGICPVVAVCTSLKTGIAMGIASAAVLVFAGYTISLLRRWIPVTTRHAITMVITTAYASMAYALLRAVAPGVCGILGPYIPLLGVNILMLLRGHRYAAHQSKRRTTLDALVLSAALLMIAVITGAMRELLAYGAVGGIPVFPRGTGISILALAPGAFFAAAAVAVAVNRSRIKKGLKPL